MIMYNVYIWMKDAYLGDDASRVLAQKLDLMVSNENISWSRWGRPADTPVRDVADKSFHYGIALHFDSVEAHNAFQSSEEHDQFVAACGHMFEKVRVLDTV